MRKINLYGAAFVTGSSMAILLSVVASAAPEATADILPLGGDNLTQASILTFPLLAIAAVIDFFRTD